MKRLLISTTCFSMVLTSGPLPLSAQTVLQIGEQEVICLPNQKTECPKGAFCVVAKRERNCEARALEALGLPPNDAAEPEADAADVAPEPDAAGKAEAEVDAIVTDDAANAEADAAAQTETDAAAETAAAAAEDEAAVAAKAEADAAAAAQAEADATAAAQAEAHAAAAAQAEADAAAAAQAEAEAADAAQAEEDAAAAAQAESDAAAAAQAEDDAVAAQAEADAAAAEAAAQAEADAATAAEADAADAAEAEAAAAAAVEDEQAVDPSAVASEVEPMTEEEAAIVLETADGVEAPTAQAVDALTDILAADPSGDGSSEALPEAAAAAAEEGDDQANPDATASATAAETEAQATETAPEPRKRRKPRAVKTEVTKEDTRTSDQDFEESALATEAARDNDGKKRLSDLEKFGLVVVGALVVGALLKNGDRVVSNTGDRVVVEQPDGTYVVLKDDDTLIRRPGSSVETETYDDGSTRSTVLYEDGSQIVTIRDAAGRVLRRTRIDVNGRQTLLINDLAPVERIDVTTLPKPLPEGRVIGADDQDAELRAALMAEETARIGRSFSLRQVREYPEVRAFAPTIDVAAISFDTGSAAIRASEARKLGRLGELMAQMVRDNPSELFLIEGHTDAVGSGAYNLALSDRRAESLALALTEYYAVPPENMVVQGYGESELLVESAGDEPRNRRTAVRVVSGLLDRTASR